MNILIDIGEFGWTLSKVAPHFRYRVIKQGVPFYVAGYRDRYHIYSDFLSGFMELPRKCENYVQSCYRLEDFTSRDEDKLKHACRRYFRCRNPRFYMPWKMFTHCSKKFNKPRLFIKYQASSLYLKFVDDIVGLDKKFIVVCPRWRYYGDGRYKFIESRNYDRKNWEVLINLMLNITQWSEYKIIAIGLPGTTRDLPSFDRFYNISQTHVVDYSALAIAVLSNSVMSIGTQSGSTILGLHCGVPSFQWGHEDERHRVVENVHGVYSGFYVTENYDVRPVDLLDHILEWWTRGIEQYLVNDF